MRITGRRIRSLSRVPKREVVPALVDFSSHAERLAAIGVNFPLVVGDSVLPAAVGPISRFNAEGGEIVHRDQPKETVWRDVYTRWLEWRGYYGAEEVWGVVS